MRICVCAVEETDIDQTLQEFWNFCNIYKTILNIAETWAESRVCVNAAWEKKWPKLVHSYKGFKKEV